MGAHREDEDIQRRLFDLAADRPEAFEPAYSWFAEQGRERVPVLAAGLKDERLGSVGHARILALLGQFAFEDTLPVVLDALSRSRELRDPLVTAKAMEALAEFRSPLAGEALIALLADGDLEIVKRAAVLCGRMGEVRSVQPLTQLLGSEDPSVRFAAARGLDLIDDAGARDALERHLAVETDSEVRELIESSSAGGSEDRGR